VRFSPEPDDALGLEPSVAETHVSVLFFAGDRAYKLKKPVRTGFLDFSSAELRREACEREVELNRRLAPDVYLGVAEVRGTDGKPCDFLVVMRRMPSSRRLAGLVDSRDGQRCIDEVARAVADFHAGARTGPHIEAQGRREAVLGRWEANIAEMERLRAALPDAEMPDRIAQLARDFLAGRGPLFGRRVAEGKVRDGHGDLLADDIYCLDDGPRIIDCLEFDDLLRFVDVVDDAAFLAMDLERLRRPDLAERFLAAYRRASGDRYPASLAHHYIAYRAHVRAKVALLRHRQGEDEALEEAGVLLRIARSHLEAARVVLVLAGGLPGTGKSTLAAGVSAQRGWELLRSDVVRKELAGVAHDAHGPAAYRGGIYREELTEATYGELLRRARELLAAGSSVVLDASWADSRRRRAASALALDCYADLVAIRCVADRQVAASRLAARGATGADPSDATPAIAEAMAGEFDDWPEAEPVDTSAGGPEKALAAAAEAIARKLS
jgi:aminoglycoside phosphotransferase family enzyme/predicted kinase